MKPHDGCQPIIQTVPKKSNPPLQPTLQPDAATVRYDDLNFAIGSWVEDKDFDDAIAEQRRVEPF